MSAHLKSAVQLALLLFALSACAQRAVSQPGGPSTASERPSAAVSGSPACPKHLEVTTAERAKTLCVMIGGTVTIDLGPDATGAGNPFDVAGSSLEQGAAEGTFAAVSPGTTVITAERRNCPAPSPGSGIISCHSIQLWKVTIEVR